MLRSISGRRRRSRSYEEAASGDGPREITALESDTRTSGYIIVEVNGVRFASLPEEAVRSLALEEGEVLDEQRLQRLCSVAAAEGAYQVAMRVVAARPRAVREVLRHLSDHGHNPDAAEEAVRRLQDLGLLDDREFSRNFARVRSGRGHGAARLVIDLLAKGVEKEVAELAVHETLEAEEVDPMQQARALAEKRCLQLVDVPPDKKRRRVMAYLRRRGYWGYEIDQVVREAMVVEGGG